MFNWLKLKHISLSVYNAIRPTGSQRPKLYGLPKTPKAGCPLRPILSMINSPQHKLAKFLITLLQPVLDKFGKYNIKDSFNFVEMVQRLPSNSVHMCSFDIKSLFTNVPLNEVIDICINQLYQTELAPPVIPKDVCYEMLRMATVDVEFSFNGQMYRQIDGIAMGSPLGPILANIFVGFHEEQLFRSSKSPVLYLRYVDDTFALFDSREEGDEFLQKLNNLHPFLKFTREDEADGKLSFLDVLIERKDNSFITSVYRKPVCNGEYIPWSSFCPKSRKIGLISCLLKRAIKICSPERLDNEIDKLKSIFLNLGYPEYIVNRTIKRTLDKNKEQITFGPEKCPVYIRLPFIGPVSNRFENQLKDGVARAFGAVRLKVAFQTQRLFNGVSKDVSPTTDINNVIYHYQCHCDSEYVGRTSQRFHLRREQHIPNNIRKWMVNQTGRKPEAKYFTAIGRHLLDNPECARNYHDGRFRILTRGRNRFHLKTLESLYIRTMKPDLCQQKQYVYRTMIFKMLM